LPAIHRTPANCPISKGLISTSSATPALRPTKPANLRVDDRTTLLSRGNTPRLSQGLRGRWQ
jgi:hypothetical protein